MVFCSDAHTTPSALYRFANSTKTFKEVLTLYQLSGIFCNQKHHLKFLL